MRALLTGVVVAVVVPALASAQAVPGPAARQATVWYLRHAGWAVRLGDALLVFDYQLTLGMDGVTDATPRNLEHGFIDPREIGELDVYVFVTHAHRDHYDPIIFDWQGRIGRTTYFVGWEEQPASPCARSTGAAARCYTMGGPRARVELDDIQVYAIDARHDGIADVAYLVRYGDWVVYHNGDYTGDFVADHAYLKTETARIDLAFVVGAPSHRWSHLARAVHVAREFSVPALFPMHFRDRAMCEAFAADVASEGVTAQVDCPAEPGQRFVLVKDGPGR